MINGIPLVPIDGQKAFDELTKYILLEDIKKKYDRLNNTRSKMIWNKFIDKMRFNINL